MNEMTAYAPHLQGTTKCVWLAFLALLRGLVLKHHNHVDVRAATVIQTMECGRLQLGAPDSKKSF